MANDEEESRVGQAFSLTVPSQATDPQVVGTGRACVVGHVFNVPEITGTLKTRPTTHKPGYLRVSKSLTHPGLGRSGFIIRSTGTTV